MDGNDLRLILQLGIPIAILCWMFGRGWFGTL